MTKCVIVAAGLSTRLRPLTDALPKCLLTVGGKTILERTVESLLGADIRNIAVVTGFQAEKIRSFLSERFPGQRFRFILNPKFASTNNAYSLLLASDYFLEPKARTRVQDRLLVLDSDIVFHPELLRRLERGEENTIAIRVSGNHDNEEVRVIVDSIGTVLKIGKELDARRSFGESIGMELFSHESGLLLFQILEKRVRQGNGRKEYYELAFQEMIDSGTEFKAIDSGDLPVMEIDSPADLLVAERSIAPLLNSASHVRVQ